MFNRRERKERRGKERKEVQEDEGQILPFC
jgi:hypothetical protein